MAGEPGSQYDGKYDDVPWLQILGMFLGLRHSGAGETQSQMAGGPVLPMFNLFDQSNLFISSPDRLFTRAMFQVKIFRPIYCQSVNIRTRFHW